MHCPSSFVLYCVCVCLIFLHLCRGFPPPTFLHSLPSTLPSPPGKHLCISGGFSICIFCIRITSGGGEIIDGAADPRPWRACVFPVEEQGDLNPAISLPVGRCSPRLFQYPICGWRWAEPLGRNPFR